MIQAILALAVLVTAGCVAPLQVSTKPVPELYGTGEMLTTWTLTDDREYVIRLEQETTDFKFEPKLRTWVGSSLDRDFYLIQTVYFSNDNMPVYEAPACHDPTGIAVGDGNCDPGIVHDVSEYTGDRGFVWDGGPNITFILRNTTTGETFTPYIRPLIEIRNIDGTPPE